MITTNHLISAMSYSEALVDKVREALVDQVDVEEKKMFQGLVFMVNGKLCVGVRNDEILFRIDPEVAVKALERIGTRAMISNGRIMKGYVFVSKEGYKRNEDFQFWILHALDFNKYARASKKRKK